MCSKSVRTTPTLCTVPIRCSRCARCLPRLCRSGIPSLSPKHTMASMPTAFDSLWRSSTACPCPGQKKKHKLFCYNIFFKASHQQNQPTHTRSPHPPPATLPPRTLTSTTTFHCPFSTSSTRPLPPLQCGKGLEEGVAVLKLARLPFPNFRPQSLSSALRTGEGGEGGWETRR